MGFLNFGKSSETFLTVVTSEGSGRLRINGVRVRDKEAKRAPCAHEQTVCWIEFSPKGGMLDKGVGRADKGRALTILRDLPGNPVCRGVLDRLREGQVSVGKWLKLGESTTP